MTVYYDVGDYHDSNYTASAVWTGIIWACLSQMGYGAMEWLYSPEEWTYATGVAVEMLTWGMELIFGGLFTMWALAFINNANWAKYYFRSIQWLVPGAWAVAFVANVCFLVGTFQDDDPIMLFYPLVYDILFIGFGAIVYFWLGEGNMNYYRWDEASWWKYNTTEWFIIF